MWPRRRQGDGETQRWLMVAIASFCQRRDAEVAEVAEKIPLQNLRVLGVLCASAFQKTAAPPKGASANFLIAPRFASILRVACRFVFSL